MTGSKTVKLFIENVILMKISLELIYNETGMGDKNIIQIEQYFNVYFDV